MLFVELALVAAVLLFTSYEAVYEAVVAVAFAVAVIAGFAMAAIVKPEAARS